MLQRILCKNLLRLPFVCDVSVSRSKKTGIPSLKDLNKPEDDYHPSQYTIFGNKRQDPLHYTDRKVGRGYWQFSNTIFETRRKLNPRIEKGIKRNFYIVFILLLGMCIDFDWLGYHIKKLTSNFRPEAANYMPIEEVVASNANDGDNGKKKKKKKKKKITFRERRIIEYENRIRSYSSPDKIFRYFATLKVMNDEDSSRSFEIFMTPEDFVRSLTPGIMQPRGLELDKFKIYDPNNKERKFADSNTIFAKLDENGLISFGDYLFLMAILSTSSSDFALAFRIFDLNGDGDLDKEEFEKLQELVLSQTNVGQRHRDHAAVGLYANKHINSALSNYFFGADGKQKLSAEKFLNFQAHLHRDVLKIEIERRDEEATPAGVISEISFAELLLVYSGVSTAKQRKMMQRVKRKYKSKAHQKGITLDEVEAFFCFLYFIEDVDLALHFYNIAGAGITGDVIKTIARKVVGRDISDHVVDVVMTLFDENENGELSQNEFVAIMKKRVKRGLEKPKDTGFIKLLDAVGKCCLTMVKDSFTR